MSMPQLIFLFICIRENEFKVKIEFVSFARMDALQELLSGKQVKAPQEALTVIDTVLKELAAKRSVPSQLSYSSTVQKYYPILIFPWRWEN